MHSQLDSIRPVWLLFLSICRMFLHQVPLGATLQITLKEMHTYAAGQHAVLAVFNVQKIVKITQVGLLSIPASSQLD